ncbi:MAG TPA: putative Ig domain-containing protein, partial [Bryobacteraceae bacterium]
MAATVPAALLSTSGTAQIALADAFGNTSNALTFNIGALTPLTIQAPSIPTLVSGTAYSTFLSATGGDALGSYNWSIASTGTPAFVNLSAGGQLSIGAASVAGTYPLVVQAQDLNGNQANVAFTLTVDPKLTITSTSPLSAAVAGIPWSTTLTASGGIPANYVWSATGLQGWLTLTANGMLSGTPPSGGSVTFTAQVTDGIQTVNQQLTLPVNAVLTIAAPPLTAAWVNQPYPPTTLTAPGGTQPYTWSISAGALPTGMILDPSAGTISGAPTTPGVATFTAQIMDSTGAAKTATQSFTLVVAQQYVITTVAGGGLPTMPAPVLGTWLPSINGISFDSAGNKYFASTNAIFKIDTNGTLTLVAGNGHSGYSGDGGRAVNAQLSAPQGTAVDGSGNIYVADIGNNRIRRIDPNGVITTIAGTSAYGSGGDSGSALSAQFDAPRGVAIDRVGAVYVADTFNNRLRKISPSGVITTVAGTGVAGYSGDGFAANGAQLNTPYAVATDQTGNVYIADSGNNVVRKISPGGLINTFAGTGASGYSGDGGPAIGALLNFPVSVASDSFGDVYVTDLDNFAIRKISSGKISTLLGNLFGISSTVAVSTSGTVCFAQGGLNNDTDGANLFSISPGPTAILIGGSNSGYSGTTGEGAASTSSQLSAPFSVTVDKGGTVYVGDFLRVRK